VTIHIENLKFQAIIGILDFERLAPQDIVVNLEINYEYKDSFINYADVADTVEDEMKKNKFLLIEDALRVISQKLKKKFPLINTLNLKISKPSILPHATVSVSDFYNFQS